ncbi:hypothetical protein ElyMa_002678700 [Elysia marginata]|uniref:Secreted protein n=1 Tax=Elysia marginata TaxID=1093978 RepID=A0AAV4HE86_9GAST|nr:hypothetical protein ElyMa_002678700 [Elysia marginata]
MLMPCLPLLKILIFKHLFTELSTIHTSYCDGTNQPTMITRQCPSICTLLIVLASHHSDAADVTTRHFLVMPGHRVTDRGTEIARLAEPGELFTKLSKRRPEGGRLV